MIFYILIRKFYIFTFNIQFILNNIFSIKIRKKIGLLILIKSEILIISYFGILPGQSDSIIFIKDITEIFKFLVIVFSLDNTYIFIDLLIWYHLDLLYFNIIYVLISCVCIHLTIINWFIFMFLVIYTICR